MDCFANDPKLGLVFPEERYLNGWDLNLQVANELAAKMGLNLPMPAYFEFSHGSMFWARPDALPATLFDLNLHFDDYPVETTLPTDGTMLTRA